MVQKVGKKIKTFKIKKSIRESDKKNNFRSGQMNIFGTFTRKKNPLAGSSTPAETTQDSRVDDYRILSLVSGKTLHNIQPRQQHRGGGGRIVLTACNQRTFIYIHECISAIYQGRRTWSKPLVTHKNDRSLKNLPCGHTSAALIGTKTIEENVDDGWTELSVGTIRIVSERH